MTQSTQLPSAEFIDGVSNSIQVALDSLFQHENALAQLSAPSHDPERAWTNSLTQLEANIAGWQTILDAMGDQVRTTQETLAVLDSDLNRSLGAFTTARKHLQGQSGEAAGKAKA